MNTDYNKATIRSGLTLGAFAVVTALVLGITYAATEKNIAAAIRANEEKALLEVLGDIQWDNDLLSDTIHLTSEQSEVLNADTKTKARVIRNKGQVTGFIFSSTATDGYSGDISMLIGLDLGGKILGVRVTEHRETPGLGDKIEIRKSEWILEFKGKSVTQADLVWAVNKDGGSFDGFAGATITPRAVVNQVKATLDMYGADFETLTKLADHSDNSSQSLPMEVNQIKPIQGESHE